MESNKILKRLLVLISVFTLGTFSNFATAAAIESGSVTFTNPIPFAFNTTVNYEIYAPGDTASPAPSVTDYTYVYNVVNNVVSVPPADGLNVPVDRFDLGIGSSSSITNATSQGAGVVPISIDFTSFSSRVVFKFGGVAPGQSSSQLIVHSPSAPGDASSTVIFSSFTDSQILRAPFALPAKDFACFDINKVEIEIKKNKIANDKLKIQKGAISFNAGEGFDPATDIVKLSLDNGTYMLSIPAGSFEQKGSKADYKYETGSGVSPKVKFRLNIDKGEWNVSIKHTNLATFLNAASLDVTLMIGDTKGQVSLPLTIDEDTASEQELKFKRSPKFSCPKLRDDDSSIANDEGFGHGHHKRSCLSAFSATYHLGLADEETISLFGGDIGHPDTTVSITAGSSATFHTSCSACMACGDTDASGNFTITEISDATGKLTTRCGIDPSCDITPAPTAP